MFSIEKLNFDQVQYVERCSLVPNGEIIQTTFNDQIVVGMRTFYNDPMGGSEAILMLSEDDRGLLVSLEQIGNAPAIVITELVRLIATNVMPFNPVYRAAVVGDLLQQPDGAFVVRGQVNHPGGMIVPAYVYLTDGKPQCPKGTCVQSLGMVNMRGISRSFEVELRPEPMAIASEV